MTSTVKTPRNKIEIALSSTFIIDSQSLKKIKGNPTYDHSSWILNSHAQILTGLNISKGETIKFYLISSFISSN